MTTPTTNWRTAIAALLATGVLLLGACSDGDEGSKKDKDDSSESDDQNAADDGDSADEGPAIDPDAPEADSEFCKDAVGVVSMDVSADAEGTKEALEAAGALEPPEEIAAAWEHVIATALEMQDLDPTDPEASQRATEAYTEIQEDNAKVVTYLQEKCGIGVGAPETSTDSGSATTGA